MSTGVELPLAAAVLAVSLVQQIRSRPVRERLPVVLDLVLVVYGLSLLAAGIRSVTRVHPITTSLIALLGANLIMAIGFGIVRARTIEITFDPPAVPMRRGGTTTIAVWLVALGAHYAVDIAIDSVAQTGRLGVSSIPVYLGITLLVQNVAVRARAARLIHVTPPIEDVPR